MSCLSPPGCHTQGSVATLQRPTQGPLAESENVADPSAPQSHSPCQQTGSSRPKYSTRPTSRTLSTTLHSQQHLPYLYHPPTKTYFITASTYPHYAFRSSRPLPRTLQPLRNHLRGSDVGTSHMSDSRYIQETDCWFHIHGNALTQQNCDALLAGFSVRRSGTYKRNTQAEPELVSSNIELNNWQLKEYNQLPIVSLVV
jgi:hypothetical protein